MREPALGIANCEIDWKHVVKKNIMILHNDVRSASQLERRGGDNSGEEYQRQQSQQRVVSMGKHGDVTPEPATKRTLNLMHEGITSFLELDFSMHGVRPSTLVSMSLHSNRVSSLEGLSSMTVRMRKMLEPWGRVLVTSCS